MPYDGSGNYSLPAGSDAVAGNTILASTHNTPLNDIASALSQVLLRSGVASMTGDLNMNGQKIEGLAAGTADSDGVRRDQVGMLDEANTFSVAGAQTFKNTSDSASVQVAAFHGDRATPTDNDNAYASFYLSNDAGEQIEFGQLIAAASDVSDGTEDGTLIFGTMSNGTLASRLGLTASALFPVANDGLALGTSSLAFSDAFLASGAVLNFGAGNYTVTHSSGNLAFSGAITLGTDLAITEGGTGASSAAGARNNFGIGTGDSVTFGAVTSSGNLVAQSGRAFLGSNSGGVAGNYTLGVQRHDFVASAQFVRFLGTAGGTAGTITGTGISDYTSVNYNTVSDGRAKPKKHRVPISDSGPVIDGLNPVRFKWLGGGGDFGFIAQEVEAVIPGFVSRGDDDPVKRPGDDGYESWGMQYGRLEPFLVAELQSVRRRLAELEGA